MNASNSTGDTFLIVNTGETRSEGSANTAALFRSFRENFSDSKKAFMGTVNRIPPICENFVSEMFKRFVLVIYIVSYELDAVYGMTGGCRLRFKCRRFTSICDRGVALPARLSRHPSAHRG